jgi:predicted HTH domain antitoxin
MGPGFWHAATMTLELPDAETKGFTAQELRLELACALYARGRIGKVRGAEIASVDFFTFQGALAERGISSYTNEMLRQDMQSLKKLFPE